MKRLLLDIETCPNVGFFWTAGYKIDISYEQILQERRIITAAFKWQGKNKVYALDWNNKQRDDEKIIKELLPVMNEADEIVAHYGNGFDLPWVRTRALFHGVVSPIWKSVDTKAWSSKYFLLNSNKLDYLAQYLGVGTKIRTDYDLWKIATMGSIKDGQKVLEKMVAYNKHDVELLEPVYDKLSLYCPLYTHAGVLEGRPRWTCVRCASEHVKRKHVLSSAAGIISYQMQCCDCKKYYNISGAVYKKFLKRDDSL